MEINEVLGLIREGGASLRKAEQAILAVFEENPEEFVEKLNTLIEEGLGEGVNDNLLRTMESAFRRNKENQAFAELMAKTMGDLYRYRLDDINRAEYYYRFLKGNESFTGEVRDFYVAFYGSRGSWSKLEQFLADEAVAKDRPRAEMYRELGKIAEEAGNQAKAVSYWQSVLKNDPDDSQASQKMEELYEAAGKWHSLVELLMKKVAGLSDSDTAAKVSILQRVVAIYRDKMNAVTKVISAYQTILDIDPENIGVMNALLELYSSMNRWPDVAKVMKKKIAATKDQDERIELLKEHADLMDTRFSNVGEAIRDYEEIMNMRPDDLQVMNKLKNLYEKRRDYEKYVGLALKLLEFEEDPDAKLEGLKKLALMASTQVRNLTVVKDLWNRVLNEDPSDIKALSQLEELHRRSKDYRSLADIVERKISLIEEDSSKRAELEKLAHLYGTQVHDEESAVNTWLRVLELDPANERAKREIRNKYQAQKRWEDLEDFLRKYATVNELAVTLESHIKDIDDPEKKKAILNRLAAVWRDEIGQPLKAIKDLEAVLAMDRTNREAIDALLELYKETAQWKKLPDIYEAALEVETDPAIRRDLMVEAAKIQEERLHKPEQAFFGYIQTLRENPLDTWLKDQAERLAGPTENWETYVEVLEDIVAAIPKNEGKAAAWHHIGELYWEKVGEADDAIRAYKEVLTLSENDTQALDALERIYTQAEKYKELADILNQKLDIQDDTASKIELLRRIAELRYERIEDTDGAISAYRQILDIRPLDIEAFQGLNGIYVKTRNFTDLLDLLEQELGVYQGVEGVRPDFIAEINLRLGMLTYGTGKDTADAIEYFGSVLDNDNFRSQAIKTLEELITLDEHRPRIIELLLKPYEDLQRFEDLADLYEIELKDKGDSTDTLDIMWKLVNLYKGPAKNDFKVYRTLGRLLEVEPGNQRVWEEMKNTARSLGDMEDLAGRFETALTKLEDIDTRIALTLMVAEIIYRDIKDVKRAEALYYKVLDDNEDFLPALMALEEIHENSQEWERLLAICQKRFDLSMDGQEKIEYAFKMADVHLEQLDNHEGAINAARLVLDLDPDNIRAYKALDNLYSIEDNQEKLEKTLLEQVRLSDDMRDRNFLRLRIADIRESSLNNIVGALEMYAAILNEDIDNEQARVNLERMFEQEELQNQIAEHLLPVYQKTEDYENQVRVYYVLVENEEDEYEKITYYTTLREICELRLNDPARAFNFAASAYRLRPGDNELTEQVTRLGELADNAKETVAVLCEKVFDIDEDDRRMETHKLIARLSLDKAVDKELAKKHLREVLELNPEDLETLDILIQVSAEDEEHENLVKYLHQKATVVFDVNEKEEILIEAGRILRYNLEDAERSIETFKMALDNNPQSFQAIEALEELYQGTGQWKELVEILEEKATSVDDLEMQMTAMKKMAQVKHHNLEDTEGAVDTLQNALALVPSDMETLDLLDTYYLELEDFSSLYEILKQKLDTVDASQRLEIFLRMGKTLLEELSDSTGALEIYRQALNEFPDSETLVERLEAMIHADEMADQAFEILVHTLPEMGQWDRLMVLYGLMAEREADPLKKVEYYTTMGTIADENMNEPTRAFDSLAKAFVLAPEDDNLLDRLYSLAETTELWEPLAEVIKAAAEQLGGGDRALVLNMKTAAVYRDKVEDLENTVICLEEVIENNPDNRDALDQLEELYDLMDKPADLARIFQNRIDIESETEQRAIYFIRLADTQKNKLENREASFDALTECMYITPANPEVIGRLRVLFEEGFKRQDIMDLLEPVYEQSENWEDMVSMYRLRLEDEPDEADRKDILLKTADILTEKMEDIAGGMDTYGQALKLDPTDDFLVDKVHELAGLTDEKTKLVDILVGASQTDDKERRIYLWDRAATASDDLARKEEIYKWIVDGDATNLKALSALDEIYTEQERWEDLEGILQKEEAASDFDDDKVKFLFRLGMLRSERLDNPEGAVESLEEAVKLDDTNRAVLDKLAEVHTTMGNPEALFRVLGHISDVATDNQDRLVVIRRMATIAEEELDEAEKAVELWEEVVANQPDDVDVLHRLQALYIGAEDWENLVLTCQREIAQIDDRERLFDLNKMIATTAQDQMDDDFMAEQHWQKALELQPGDKECLDRLSSLYRKNEEYERLIEILEKMILSGIYEQDEVLNMKIERAGLLTTEVPRTEDAIIQWLEVLDEQSNHMDALQNLQELYEQNSQFQESVGILEKLAELAEEPEKQVELLTQAAETTARQVGDTQHASELYARIIEIAPNNLDAYEQYEMLLRTTERWDELAETLLKKVDALEETDDKVAALYEISGVYENQLGKPELALVIYQKSLLLDPENESGLEELWRLSQSTGMWEEYVDFIEEVQEKLSGDSLVSQLMRAASVASARMNAPERAIKLYTTVVTTDEDRMGAWDALVELYDQTGNNEELVKALHERAERSMDYSEKVSYLLREARIYRDDFKDTENAVRVYNEVLDTEEDNDEALEALVDIYKQTAQWNEYIKILKQVIEIHPERESELNKEIGRVFEEELEDEKKAIEAYEEVLSINPTESDVLERLKVLYGSQNDWEGLAAVYERLQEASQVDADRIMFLKYLGVLWEDAMGQPEKALKYWQDILLMDPLEEEAIEKSSILMTQTEEWEDLVNLYESVISRSEDIAIKVDFLNKITDLYEENLDDPDNAAMTLRRIIETAPEQLSAYSRLADLYEKMEYFNEQVNILMAWKDQVDEPDEAANLMVRAARILRENQDFDRTATVLWDAIRLNPEYKPAAEELIDLYTRTGEWQKVVEVYKRQLQFAQDEDKATLLARLGELSEDKFKESAEAISYYEQALDMNPGLGDVSLRLANLYVQQESWPKAQALLEVLLDRMESEDDLDKLAQVHFLIAQSDEHLGDTDKAYREYQQAIKLKPDHIRAAFGLAQVHFNKGRYQLAKDQYELLLQRGPDTFSREDLILIYLNLADIETKMEETKEAKSVLMKMLEISPNDPRALEMLVEIAEKEEDWNAMVQYSHELLETKVDPYERFAILIEIGDIYADKLNSIHGSVASFKKALEIDNRSKVALLRLFEIYVKGSMKEKGLIEDAIGVLERLAEVEESKEKRAKDYFRAAVLFKEQLHDDFKAIEFIEKSLDEDPSQLDAFRMMDEILTKRKDWEAEAEAYQRMIDRITGKSPNLEFKLYFYLGEIYRTRIRDLKRASDAFLQATRIKSDDPRTRLILADLFEHMDGRNEEAIEQHRAIVHTAPLKKEVVHSFKKMKELYLKDHQFDKALAMSSLMIAMESGDAEERDFYRDNMGPTLPYFQKSLDEMNWNEHLMSRDQNPLVGTIFQIIFEGLARDLGAKDLKDLGLKSRNEISTSNDRMFFVKVYKAVTKALGTPPNKVYRDDSRLGLGTDFLLPPPLIIGPDALSDKGQRELGFLLGRQLAFLHPTMFLPTVKSIRELKVFMAAALKFARPQTSLGRGADVVMQVVGLLDKRLNAHRKDLMTRVVGDLLATGNTDFTKILQDYRRGMEKTALRAGALVAGDAVPIFEILRTEKRTDSELTQHERMEEIAKFMVSKDYFILRDSLGISEEEPG